jgi:bifunctional N-acetylglucosamine-1-phosphate-uridyltransferase/glucosamine-1-phosphate-acetyltransferase GlmU-like protein
VTSWADSIKRTLCFDILTTANIFESKNCFVGRLRCAILHYGYFLLCPLITCLTSKNSVVFLCSEINNKDLLPNKDFPPTGQGREDFEESDEELFVEDIDADESDQNIADVRINCFMLGSDIKALRKFLRVSEIDDAYKTMYLTHL